MKYLSAREIDNYNVHRTTSVLIVLLATLSSAGCNLMDRVVWPTGAQLEVFLQLLLSLGK